MSNENQLNALLNEDLSDVPTSQPQLKGPFEFEVIKAEMKETKASISLLFLNKDVSSS